MHILDINIDDSSLNPRSLKIEDNSSFDEHLPISNLLLEIIPPGFNNIVPIRVNKGFSKILNANLLHLNSSGSKMLPSLPDGLYNIKISVDPNLKTIQEYWHFRNVIQKIQYFDNLTYILNNSRKYTKSEFLEKKEKLLWIRELMEGCKYMAEDQNDTVKAMDMYKSIIVELDKFNKEC